MLYLSEFRFPDADREYSFRLREKRTCFDTMYPFFVLSKHSLERLDFEPITILYGGNGSGKTTALNVIAEKLGLKRDSLFNRSDFYGDYLDMCLYKLGREHYADGRIITSDDVFDFMLDVRSVNDGIDAKRSELFDEYTDCKYSSFQLRSLDDYDRLKKVCASRSKTMSKYVRANLKNNIRERSNGESAFAYFTDRIGENGLYLLDEPENSLAPERQTELVKYLEDSVRYFGCQLIIATHSPFLLAMRGAKIYDFDEDIVDVKKWTELHNVMLFYEFFKSHEKDFESDL